MLIERTPFTGPFSEEYYVFTEQDRADLTAVAPTPGTPIYTIKGEVYLKIQMRSV